MNPIMLAISGGLDSRYIGGLLKEQGIPIDIGFTIYWNGQERNAGYAEDIGKILDVGVHYIIKVTREDVEKDLEIIKTLPLSDQLEKSGNYTGLRLLSEIEDTKECNVPIPYGLDVLTGVHINPLTLFTYRKYERYYFQTKHALNQRVINEVWGRFGKACNPIWNDKYISFWMRQPLFYRFHQSLFRYVIKTRWPELARIPREDMHVSMDISDTRYFVERTKYWARKQSGNLSRSG